jgi:hypothetical protein
MKRIRIVGLCLVAVFALSAVAASAAFGAESAFLNSKKEGPTSSTTSKGKGVGVSFFEGSGGGKVECEKSASEGHFVGELEARVTKLEYSGNCKLTSSIANESCPTIKINELKVLPGTEVGNEKVRLEVFLPVSGSVMTEFTCGSVKVKVTGGVVCQNKNPKLGLKTEIECKGSKGVQEFTKAIVNGKEETDSLEAESSLSIFKLKEKDAQNTTEEVTSSAEVEQTE